VVAAVQICGEHLTAKSVELLEKSLRVLPLKLMYSEIRASVRVFKAHKVVSDVSVTVQIEYF